MHARLFGSYVHAYAQFDLVCMVATAYVDTLSLKFKKDQLNSCGEIDVLLALDNSVINLKKTEGSVKKTREGQYKLPKVF